MLLHPLPIEAEWRELENDFLPRVETLALGFDVEVQPQGLVADATQYIFDLLISVPWKDLPADFSLLLGALIAWRGERRRRADQPEPRPYNVQVLYAEDGSVLKEIEIPPAD